MKVPDRQAHMVHQEADHLMVVHPVLYREALPTPQEALHQALHILPAPLPREALHQEEDKGNNVNILKISTF